LICRICDSPAPEPVIDLGLQPWCNHFLRADEIGSEPFYPLRVVYCHTCSAAQLDYTVRKEVMFGDHTYLSGVTRSLAAHFDEVSREVDERFFRDTPRKSVLDVGSNDGTQLKRFQALGYDVLGVESSATTARIANDAHVPTLHAFFNESVAADLGRTFDVINAAGVFFHLEELHSAAEGIRKLLAPSGVFVVQFLYMKTIVENGAFDQIYHEHLLYYTLSTLQRLLDRHGLQLFDARFAPIHGGTIVAFAGHPGAHERTERLARLHAAEEESHANDIETYRGFARRIEELRERELAVLRAARADGLRVFGLGAPVKGNTLLNYFGAGPELIECLVERNPLRRGLFSPGMHIPVRIEDEIETDPDLYYVLAWNFKKEILERYAGAVANGVRFHFPVEPREVPA